MKNKINLLTIIILIIFIGVTSCILFNVKKDKMKNAIKAYGIDKIEMTGKNQKIIINDIKGYTPSQIKHAYGIDKIEMTGKNQKIAIVVPYGSTTIENDVKIFNKQFNIEPVNLEISYPQGKPDSDNFDWALETALDVEWLHALAPKASILLIVSKSDSTEDLINAIDYTNNIGVNIISMSWAISEFKEELDYESHFENKSTIFIASTGDNGSEINWPAVSAHVLAVGGTTFSLDLKGNFEKNEVGWSESGGGISKYMIEPKYQMDYGINSNGHRAIPDVSFYADSLNGVAVYCSSKYDNQGGWTTLAGTSLGTPAWAAVIALINEGRPTPITNIHDELYKLSKNESQYSEIFRDITSGTTNLYNSQNGYDYLTGLGSPITNNLYKALTN